MAHSKQANKRIRTSEKKRVDNKARMSRMKTETKITGLSEKPCPRRGREGEALENQLPEAIGKATAGHLSQIIRFLKRRQRGAV